MHEGSSEALVDELAELAELPRASGLALAMIADKLALAMTVVQQLAGIA